MVTLFHTGHSSYCFAFLPRFCISDTTKICSNGFQINARVYVLYEDHRTTCKFSLKCILPGQWNHTLGVFMWDNEKLEVNISWST